MTPDFELPTPEREPLYRALVYVKGKSKPVLFESIRWIDTLDGGVLCIQFPDNSSVRIASGWWRECDVERMPDEVRQDAEVRLPDAPVPENPVEGQYGEQL